MSDCIHCDGDGLCGSAVFCFCPAGDAKKREYYGSGVNHPGLKSPSKEPKGPSNPNVKTGQGVPNPLGSVYSPQVFPPNLGSPEGVRKFDTGATRSAEGDKPDYEGFLSPTALIRFGQYMHKHRKQADGNLRASDNWQKGIPIPQYLKSLFRHLVSTWALWRGVPEGRAPSDTEWNEQEENLCAILFNAQGMLHEILKARAAQKRNPLDEWMKGVQ
jgi:hypothetical protein